MHGQDISSPHPGSDHTRHLATALILLSLVVIGGTVGFVVIEGWDAWRALFFTLITITTVGYGDEGISDDGKKFATLLLIGGTDTLPKVLANLMLRLQQNPDQRRALAADPALAAPALNEAVRPHLPAEPQTACSTYLPNSACGLRAPSTLSCTI